MDFRLKSGIRNNLSLPHDKIFTTEFIDGNFRLHQESPPIEDDTVYSFDDNQTASPHKKYEGYNPGYPAIGITGTRDSNAAQSVFQANQQQSNFLTIQGQQDYDILYKLNQQPSPSFSKETSQGIDDPAFPNFGVAERDSYKKQLITNSVQNQNMSPSWTSPPNNVQRQLFIDSTPNGFDSRKNSISSNHQSQQTQPFDLNDSFSKNNDNYQQKMSTYTTGNDEEVLDYNQGKYSVGNSKNTGSLSKQASMTTTAFNEINCLVLEEATQEALRNIASRLTNSSRKRKTSNDALNSSLLAKHLEGEKSLKTPSSVQQQKSKRPGATTPSAVRKDIKRDTTPSSKLNKSIDKGIKQQNVAMNKGKDETIKRNSTGKTGSQILEQKHKSSRSQIGKELNKSSSTQVRPAKNLSFSMNNSFVEKVEYKKSTTTPIDFQLTEPCLADKADVDPRLVTADCFAEQNEVTEEAQTAQTDPLEDVIVEKYNTQLIASIQKLSIRTFLALRSIIRPNENILACCQAFVKLFAGLNDAIPPSFAIMGNIEWENIKILFNSPVKVLKLISTVPVFIEYKKIPQRNVNAAIATLSKIPYELGDTQNEAFYQMYEFIVSAVEYYKFYKPVETTRGTEIQGTPRTRRSTVLQDSPLVGTVRTMTPETKTQPLTMKKQDASVIGFATPSNKSKSPLRQSQQNILSKSAYASVSNKTTRASTSPFKEGVSSRKSSQDPVKKVNSQYNSSIHRKSTGSVRSSASLVTGVRPAAKESSSPMRSVVSSIKNIRMQESFDSQYFTQGEYTEGDQGLGNERSLIMKTDVSEMADFHDEAARKKREGLSYKARASRLLADHERYVKRTLKAQEEEQERINRELNSLDRDMLIDYIETKKDAEKSYLKEIAVEELAAKKEVKRRQAKVQEMKQNDDMMETIKQSSFVATQVEKKKYEKKKELWDQYKKKMAEKSEKKQREAEKVHLQKKESHSNKVESIEWKKKQASQETDKWKENYLLLARLVGEER